MVDLHATLMAGSAMFLLALAGWTISLIKGDVSIVDSFWSLFFLSGALAYAASTTAHEPRATLLLVLVTLWALRLAGYLTWRNWGEPEDRRYQSLRARHQPGFAWKSLYLIFGFQVLLAAIIALPLFVGLSGTGALNLLDATGLALWTLGFGFETVGDWQLARFKADPSNRAKVLDTGLWRYTRHPNYFGEAALWWGYYLIAAAAGGWWTVFAPLLMTFLLLRISGVTLLEQDIHERRPPYRDYIARTNAFFPGPPRGAA
jgi:steroid 5-alpha reductase family enzyme